MTEKENFMKLMRGECPEWIPTYTFGKIPGDPHVPATAKITAPNSLGLGR